MTNPAPSAPEPDAPRGTLTIVAVFGALVVVGWLLFSSGSSCRGARTRFGRRGPMQVDRYERYWMWAATGMLALFLGAIVRQRWLARRIRPATSRR